MATLMTRSMDERVPAHDELFAQRIQRRFASVAVDALPLPKRQAPRATPSWAKR